MKRPALPDAVSWDGAATRHRPFLLLDFRPCIRTGKPLLLYGEGPAFTRAANASQTGGEGYFLDLVHKTATRGRQAAHRGVLSCITFPGSVVLFLLAPSAGSLGHGAHLQKSALWSVGKGHFSFLPGRSLWIHLSTDSCATPDRLALSH